MFKNKYCLLCSFLLLSSFSSSFSKIHKCNQQRTTSMGVYDAIECSLFFLFLWLNQWTNMQRKKKKRTYRSSATQGCTICAYACKNLEHLFELVVVALNKILLPFSKQCVLFLIRFLFRILFDTFTSIIYAIFLLFSLMQAAVQTHIYAYIHMKK